MGHRHDISGEGYVGRLERGEVTLRASYWLVAWRCVAARPSALFCRAMECKSPDTTLHVRLQPELRSRLEELAAREDRPLSWIVRRALKAATQEIDNRGQAA